MIAKKNGIKIRAMWGARNLAARRSRSPTSRVEEGHGAFQRCKTHGAFGLKSGLLKSFSRLAQNFTSTLSVARP
jgi:hypothetical protein